MALLCNLENLVTISCNSFPKNAQRNLRGKGKQTNKKNNTPVERFGAITTSFAARKSLLFLVLIFQIKIIF